MVFITYTVKCQINHKVKLYQTCEMKGQHGTVFRTLVLPTKWRQI